MTRPVKLLVWIDVDEDEAEQLGRALGEDSLEAAVSSAVVDALLLEPTQVAVAPILSPGEPGSRLEAADSPFFPVGPAR